MADRWQVRYLRKLLNGFLLPKILFEEVTDDPEDPEQLVLPQIKKVRIGKYYSGCSGFKILNI
jgi:hypothetical protein